MVADRQTETENWLHTDRETDKWLHTDREREMVAERRTETEKWLQTDKPRPRNGGKQTDRD